MHETMVAQNVLNAILQESDKRNLHPVGAKISCGQLNTLNDDVFCFAFAAYLVFLRVSLYYLRCS